MSLALKGKEEILSTFEIRVLRIGSNKEEII
jgi:hypothetical protein